MAKLERGLPLVERIIERVAPHVNGIVQGASRHALDELESQLMVELPATLRRYLEFDFTFASFGSRWRGKHRFGPAAHTPRPRITSLRKIAEAMTDMGWTAVSLRRRVVRLPNLPDHPWNCLYLGEPRRDGELPIIGLVNDESTVIPYLRYTAFDAYLAEQSGIVELTDSVRLDDLDTTLSLNPELTTLAHDDEYEAPF